MNLVSQIREAHLEKETHPGVAALVGALLGAVLALAGYVAVFLLFPSDDLREVIAPVWITAGGLLVASVILVATLLAWVIRYSYRHGDFFGFLLRGVGFTALAIAFPVVVLKMFGILANIVGLP